ncbi:RTA1 like protein-domain-containing protein [Lipomyces kononenkoae]|uniref:RTA1 like protein-domain-containing protein n=1 Tax=Lipomyces kononenkoae TaxID=34357 RepID=A0ACC3T2C7_LIPKO
MSSTCKEIGPSCPADGSDLSYAPNLIASVVFVVVFGTSLVLHGILGWKTRTWSFLVAYFLGSSSEVIGYLGRIFLHSNPYKLSTFLLQIVCLTTGPAFYSAGLYLCLARIAAVYGENISRIRPIWYTRIFITCDVISLSLQGTGGGVASAATKSSTLAIGNDIMLAGLVFQVATLALFAVLCLEFTWRVHQYPHRKKAEFRHIRESRRFKRFLVAAAVTFVTIFIRCVYRIVELAGGWNNKLQREEVPYIILESGMISIAVSAFVFCHPGYAFHGAFNGLQGSTKVPNKENDVEMPPQCTETQFLPNKQDM